MPNVLVLRRPCIYFEPFSAALVCVLLEWLCWGAILTLFLVDVHWRLPRPPGRLTLVERLMLPPLRPPLQLTTQDVDADPALAALYGIEVPLLAVGATGAEPGAEAAEVRWRLLPRVPPRLEAERLRDWLRRQGVD